MTAWLYAVKKNQVVLHRRSRNQSCNQTGDHCSVGETNKNFKRIIMICHNY